ncbi:tail protein X [Methylobacterium gregans]|uniref:Uncharacterized protein n=1 Tax=Methylobacterium gregans TaxID=374424 RepID=A0AA37HMS3_9HYPH|nr:tail protein X [Methylobacterium gregans]MDQ0521938.1 phage tail protein X [Methylobacterium gregans]GJD78028.1 hypothetical protein NBEOAGPD_1240 [Methylobacterium gregans]GLS51998.1 P2-like prophage tail protein X [Methylobacterium gregans]
MAIETLQVERAPCPLDLLLFLRFRREVPGLLEDTLARNPGLAALGPVLPYGTAVVVAIPDPPATARTITRELLTLF